MSLKVFQLAKELGIDSKAIVRKCKDEGVPNIDTHMSPVSAGLAETIREWFAAGSDLRNAVESTPHADVAKLKATNKPRKSKKGGAQHADEGGGTAVAEAPVAEPSVVEEVTRVEPSVAEPAPEIGTEAAPVAEEPEAVVEAVVEAPIAPEAPGVPEVTIAAEAPAVVDEPEAAAESIQVEKAPHAPAAPAELKPAAVAPVKPAVPHVAQVPQKPVRPAVMPRGIQNVPTRPTVVSPVGPRVQPAPAQMQGPRVVRMEQPDNLPAPRPRMPRQMSGPGMGQQNGPGYQGGQGFQGGQNRGPGMGQGGPGGPGGATFTPLLPTPGTTPSRGHGASKGRAGATTSAEDEEAAAKKKGRSTRRSGGRHADAGMDLIREWREADLLDRSQRIASASGVLRDRKREMHKQSAKGTPGHGPAVKSNSAEVMAPVTIRGLAEAMGIKSSEIVRKLVAQGIMATVNQTLDTDTAMAMALEFGMELTVKEVEPGTVVLEREFREAEEQAEKVLRPPVVTILGHVDHGKTSLLDKIRSANVAAGEAGGITQHVGAYTVNVPGSDGKEKRVTFLDTPGHQAFTSMRARGANVTDVVVLVVAADDGVMPQTIESIDHAKAAKVPIVVAMNKIDKPEANPNRVLGQLAEHGLNPAEWGGDVEVVRTSAVTGQGIKELIEYLDYVATLRDLKASPSLPARGAVIESFMDPARGTIGRVLVQNGTLKIGDMVVCGPASGRVRSLIDDKGKQIREAGPATPVELVGLDGVPDAGEKFYVVLDPNRAKDLAEERAMQNRAGEIAKRNKVTLDNLFETIKEGDVKELPMILKADVQGSVDVLKHMMTEELSKEVKVNLIRAAVGGISESDVLLAETTGAIVVGFSVVPDEAARKLAEDRGVEIRLYRIIYEITDDIRKALAGMLSPEKQEQILGHADVRQVIKISRVGNVAGCIVSDGVLQRNNKYRVTRDGVVLAENLALESLKRFKDDVKEVRGGLECGIKVANFDDLKPGDRFEAYKTVDVVRTL